MTSPHYHVWRQPDATWSPTHDWDFEPPITLPPRDTATIRTTPHYLLSPLSSCPGQGLGWCDCPPDPEEDEPPP